MLVARLEVVAVRRVAQCGIIEPEKYSHEFPKQTDPSMDQHAPE